MRVGVLLVEQASLSEYDSFQPSSSQPAPTGAAASALQPLVPPDPHPQPIVAKTGVSHLDFWKSDRRWPNRPLP